ncbi:hypothetical protein F5X98DRAFT_373834 [Xylaria grammica]|nr:hypothetical protein F5X98DRAFT_373834 [Xylaria grammica]
MTQRPHHNGTSVTYHPENGAGPNPGNTAGSNPISHVIRDSRYFTREAFNIRTIDLHVRYSPNDGYMPVHKAVLARISGLFEREIARRCCDDEPVCTIQFEGLYYRTAFEICLYYGYRGNDLLIRREFRPPLNQERFWFYCEVYSIAHFLEMPVVQDQVLVLIAYILDMNDRSVDPSNYYSAPMPSQSRWAIGERAQFRYDIVHRILACARPTGMKDILYVLGLWFNDYRWHDTCNTGVEKIVARFPDLEESIIYPEGSPFEHLRNYAHLPS